MRTLIASANKQTRTQMAHVVSRMLGWDVVGVHGHGRTAIVNAEKNEPDVVCADMDLRGVNGLSVAGRMARWTPPPALILMGRGNHHALLALEVGVDGFIPKPASNESIASRLRSVVQPRKSHRHVLETMTQGRANRKAIIIHQRRRVISIPVEDVMYFTADGKYVRIVHMNGEAWTEEPLVSFERTMGEWFVRVHRHSLVAIRWIQSIGKGKTSPWSVMLKESQVEIPVSRRRLGHLHRIIVPGRNPCLDIGEKT